MSLVRTLNNYQLSELIIQNWNINRTINNFYILYTNDNIEMNGKSYKKIIVYWNNMISSEKYVEIENDLPVINNLGLINDINIINDIYYDDDELPS